MEAKERWEDFPTGTRLRRCGQLYPLRGEPNREVKLQVELIDRILDDENIKAAIRAVKSNKGAAGIDKMTVDALEAYMAMHWGEIKQQIRAKQYKPQPVRRVYIPKANGKQRPLGIPTVVDRVIYPTGTGNKRWRRC